jgi:hypothetical protein
MNHASYDGHLPPLARIKDNSRASSSPLRSRHRHQRQGSRRRRRRRRPYISDLGRVGKIDTAGTSVALSGMTLLGTAGRQPYGRFWQSRNSPAAAAAHHNGQKLARSAGNQRIGRGAHNDHGRRSRSRTRSHGPGGDSGARDWTALTPRAASLAQYAIPAPGSPNRP